MSRISLIFRALLLAPVLIFALGCGNDSGQTLPRREAYPRIEIYPEEYVQPTLPVEFPVNRHAQISTESRADGTVWLTAHYPNYGADLYCTFSPVEGEKEIADVVENRLERMHLNIADASVNAEQASSLEYHSTLVTTRTLSSTPVQFLIYPAEKAGWVVSGSVFFPGLRPGASLDSITPAIEALSTDIRHALSTFHSKTQSPDK